MLPSLLERDKQFAAMDEIRKAEALEKEAMAARVKAYDQDEARRHQQALKEVDERLAVAKRREAEAKATHARAIQDSREKEKQAAKIEADNARLRDEQQEFDQVEMQYLERLGISGTSVIEMRQGLDTAYHKYKKQT